MPKNGGTVTQFDDFDIFVMSAGPSDVVFEAGGILYLMNAATLEYKPVAVQVLSDLSVEMPVQWMSAKVSRT